MTGNSSPIAFGLPGKLMISDRPAIPDTPRVRIPIGVWRTASARLASAHPGAGRVAPGPGAHRRAKPGGGAFEAPLGGLGGDVSVVQPVPAGGEDERGAAG